MSFTHIPQPLHGFFLISALFLSFAQMSAAQTLREVRGTWLTTTANRALASSAEVEQSMKRLKEIGLNTVYVESWKNGYTHFPSKVLQRAIGVSQSPPLFDGVTEMRQNHPRDLLEESLIAAHRQGLIYISWFEYGLMAAHQSSNNPLRQNKPLWLSRDIDGKEIASNGFVWLNPLHPEVQDFVIELVLEAIENYDIDGIQFDDRLAWPDPRMGYDTYTQSLYAQEHAGQMPPINYREPEWLQWRADKLTQFAQRLVTMIRAKRPGLLISLSPAVYPWSREHYLLSWPEWRHWRSSASSVPDWDEFVPQAYRLNYQSFATTWQQQVDAMPKLDDTRQTGLLAGIRVVGEGPQSTWEELRASIEFVRKKPNQGHVLWYSRGILDLYAEQLHSFYAQSGPAISPYFPPAWRRASIPLKKLNTSGATSQKTENVEIWGETAIPPGRYHVIANDGKRWYYLPQHIQIPDMESQGAAIKRKNLVTTTTKIGLSKVELIVDHRSELMQPRP